MENWLRCTISPGQFEGEYGVDGKQFNGTTFSLFVSKESVRYSTEPTKEKAVAGWIRVEVAAQHGDLVLVLLPRPTFQNGPYVTVKPDQLENAPVKPSRRPEKVRRNGHQ